MESEPEEVPLSVYEPVALTEPAVEAPSVITDAMEVEATLPETSESPVEEEPVSEEAVKVIETRIGLPLYNVYLNEADEWSRRLVTCLQEWALELHEPLPDTAVALAHSLAGSSATVGIHRPVRHGTSARTRTAACSVGTAGQRGAGFGVHGCG